MLVCGVLPAEAAQVGRGLFPLAETTEERVRRFSIAEAAEVRREWFSITVAAEMYRWWFSIWYGGRWIAMGYQVIDQLRVFDAVAAATISDATESFRATEASPGTVFFGMTAPAHRWTGVDIGDDFGYMIVGIILR